MESWCSVLCNFLVFSFLSVELHLQGNFIWFLVKLYMRGLSALNNIPLNEQLTLIPFYILDHKKDVDSNTPNAYHDVWGRTP